MQEITLLSAFGVSLVVFVVMTIVLSIMFRRVVSTNTVHIVQSRRKTTPYGTTLSFGNVYYRWPSWLPYFGVTVIELPVSNFDLSLKDYEAYDKDRVPFKVDVTSFFRIKDTALAAQRVASIRELEEQLSLIVQGAVRKVLASDVIDSIMLERSKFGEQFTSEVSEQLKEWGVESVKSMELMDIRDSHESKVISNIMAKKTSHIEMQSRVEVANNMKTAKAAEIEAKQIVDVRQQEADEAVGKRTAERDKQVGIAQQQSRQEVLTQEKQTQERSMDVKHVEQVRLAEITKEKEVVGAEQSKQTTIITADGTL
ncbi:MAG: SPFH domain-containing protein, partial [Candidatus Yanofskybacteria bacterium]|nr:SPFH domain-containing protein [Candidatus Yanofskybacteria bacterium]